jgi:hypothetical protein
MKDTSCLNLQLVFFYLKIQNLETISYINVLLLQLDFGLNLNKPLVKT